jgi:hypothetical protein
MASLHLNSSVIVSPTTELHKKNLSIDNNSMSIPLFCASFTPHTLHNLLDERQRLFHGRGIKTLDERLIFVVLQSSSYPAHQLSSSPYNMKFFSSSLFVFALSLFVVASPAPSGDTEDALVARQNTGTVPNTSVLPLTIYEVFQILNVAVEAITPGIGDSFSADISKTSY